MEIFYKLLESARTDKQNISRKVRLLHLTISREPQFTDLAGDLTYSRAVEAFFEFGSNADNGVRDMNLDKLKTWSKELEDKAGAVIDIISEFCTKNKKKLKKATIAKSQDITNLLSHS